MLNVTHWSWFGPTEVELDPADGLGREAEHAFKNGQCHALALELHSRTGWPLVGLDWDEHPDLEDTPVPSHVAVRHPDTGDVLDVGGWQAESRWNGGVFDTAPVDRDYVENFLPTIGYLEPDSEAARIYADLVLAAYAPDVLAA